MSTEDRDGFTEYPIPIAPEHDTPEKHALERTLIISAAEEETLIEEIEEVRDMFVNARHFNVSLPALNAFLTGLRSDPPPYEERPQDR